MVQKPKDGGGAAAHACAVASAIASAVASAAVATPARAHALLSPVPVRPLEPRLDEPRLRSSEVDEPQLAPALIVPELPSLPE